MDTTDQSSHSRPMAALQSRGLCTFWLGGRQFGLEVGLVVEIVSVEAVLSVPKGPRPILGLFNLRGTPIALFDLGEILDLGERTTEAKSMALVIRHEDVVVGLLVDRMEAVLPPGRGVSTQAAAEDHPAVDSFLTLEDTGSVVTMIRANHLLERLESLRFTKAVG